MTQDRASGCVAHRRPWSAADADPPQHLTCGKFIFARTGERDRYAADRPLNLLWNAFAEATPTRAVPSAVPGQVVALRGPPKMQADGRLGKHLSLSVAATKIAYVPDNAIADTGLA